MRHAFALFVAVAAAAFFAVPAFAAAASPAISTPEAANAWSLAPPLLAIAAALIFRQVILALFLGVALGAWLILGATPDAVVPGFFAAFQEYAVEAVADADHASIIVFTMMIGGMVGIISKNKGLNGIANAITKWANTRAKAMTGTSLLGFAIFFDDYANTLVVGNTMRPITDRMKISREKLAYIVDSTAAPITSVALITTWVGYQVGLIGDATKDMEGFDEPYLVFLNTIPYSFYPLLALAFVLLISVTGRDFGPMRKAESDAVAGRATRGETLPSEPHDADGNALNAFLPIAVLVGVVVAGLFITGEGDTISAIIGSSNSYSALLWGSFAGALTAMALTLAQRIMGLSAVFEAWGDGVKEMVAPVMVLILAWALSAVTQELGTAQFLVATLGDTIPIQIMPALVFVIAAATAFATGTSWGVMGILIPLVIPLIAAMAGGGGAIPPDHAPILYSTIACVLAGAVWGDHCSPISDTTILSSLASGCDHIEHVRTQMPYALIVGAAAVVFGTLPVGFGLPWWAGLALGAAALFFAHRLLARPPDAAPKTA